MDIKTVVVINDPKLFEENIKNLVEQGYTIKASNFSIENTKTIGNRIKITENKYYFYALLQKE